MHRSLCHFLSERNSQHFDINQHSHPCSILVLTVVIRKSSLFRDIMQCSMLKTNSCLGGIFRPSLQGHRISQIRNQHDFATWFIMVLCFVFSSTLKVEETWSFETSVDIQRIKLQLILGVFTQFLAGILTSISDACNTILIFTG